MGERILAEWEPPSGRADNLTRWLAHYLAEIIEAAKNESDATRRSRLRRECADLVLAIWKHREHWPRGQPFKALGSLVQELSVEKNLFAHHEQPHSWASLIKELEALHQREKRWLMKAAAANESERATTEWESVATPFFSDDESRLATLSKQLLGDSSTTALKAETSAQKHRQLLKALRGLQDDRVSLHAFIKEDWFETAPAVRPRAKTKRPRRPRARG